MKSAIFYGFLVPLNEVSKIRILGMLADGGVIVIRLFQYIELKINLKRKSLFIVLFPLVHFLMSSVIM